MTERRCVITVGNFDGVHLGHRALLAAGRTLADEARCPLVALSFEQHPATVVAPEQAPPPLMDRHQRAAALAEPGPGQRGADQVAWLPTDAQILGLTPEQFVDRVVAEHGPVAWVEGPDFRFGKDRAGDMDHLASLGRSAGFTVQTVPTAEVTLRDKTVCPVRSSLVRWLVSTGRMTDAHLCLGRPFAVRGRVVRGEQRGRQIGFPTINLDAGDRLLPADGVYAGWTKIDGDRRPAAISVGTKPTFEGSKRLFEAHLIDTDKNLYDQTLEVSVDRWLRDQTPFPSVDELVTQLGRDVDQTRRLADAGMLAPAALAQTGAAETE